MRREQRLKRRAHLDGGDMEAFTDANEEAEHSEAGAAEVALQDVVLCRGDGHSNRHGEVLGGGNSGVGGLRTSNEAGHPNTEQEFG